MTDKKNTNLKLNKKSGDLSQTNIISNYDQLSKDKTKLIKMTGALKEAKPKIESLIVSSLKVLCENFLKLQRPPVAAEVVLHGPYQNPIFRLMNFEKKESTY